MYPSIALEAKGNHICTYLRDMIDMIDKTPYDITRKLIEHSYQLTSKSRDFMEENPSSAEPRNYIKFPGKMDHCSCITYRIGEDMVYPTKKIKKIKGTFLLEGSRKVKKKFRYFIFGRY